MISPVVALDVTQHTISGFNNTAPLNDSGIHADKSLSVIDAVHEDNFNARVLQKNLKKNLSLYKKPESTCIFCNQPQTHPLHFIFLAENKRKALLRLPVNLVFNAKPKRVVVPFNWCGQ